MAKLFLSHSSSDKPFVKKLANDLIELGHDIWLDEWQIRVGDCIVKGVEKGIEESDYVIMILSENSVNSTWVEKEWRTKYWDEINSNEVLILPVLKELCEIPALLKTKKYADFTKSYSIGFHNLASSLGVNDSVMVVKNLDNRDLTKKVKAVLSKVQSGRIKLSECMTECLSIASETEDPILERFCTVELKGLEHELEYPDFLHRRIEAYATLNQINTQFVGWGGDLTQAFEMMENNRQEFFPTRFMIWHPIFELEEHSLQENINRKLLTFPLKAKHLPGNFSNPELPVYIYAKASSLNSVLNKARNRLTEILLEKV